MLTGINHRKPVTFVVARPASSFFASASPLTPGGTGTRYFGTDTRGTIFYSTSAAVANPIVITTVVQ